MSCINSFHELEDVSIQKEISSWYSKNGYTWFTSNTKPSTLSEFLFADGNGRLEVWKLLFGEKPMPTIEDNAVEKNFGILDQYFKKPIDEETFENIVKHSRRKTLD